MLERVLHVCLCICLCVCAFLLIHDKKLLGCEEQKRLFGICSYTHLLEGVVAPVLLRNVRSRGLVLYVDKLRAKGGGIVQVRGGCHCCQEACGLYVCVCVCVK